MTGCEPDCQTICFALTCLPQQLSMLFKWEGMAAENSSMSLVRWLPRGRWRQRWCSHVMWPTTPPVFINLQNMSETSHREKKQHLLEECLLVTALQQFSILDSRETQCAVTCICSVILKYFCRVVTLICYSVVWLSVNIKVSMTSSAWSAGCRGGWVQTPPSLFSHRQETEDQWIELRWSRQFNWLASEPKKLILFSALLQS